MKEDKFCANYYAEMDSQGKITALHSELDDETFEIKTMTDENRGILSKKNFKAGEIINSCKSLIVSPDKLNKKIRVMVNGKEYSPIDKDTHPTDYTHGKWLLFFWDSFLNHSCNPNICTKKSSTLQQEDGYFYYDNFAVRDIKAGDELFFDYDIFVYDAKDFGFECNCDSENCQKLIRGFKYLEPEKKRKHLTSLKSDNEVLYSYFIDLMKKDSDIALEAIN